MSLCAVSLNPSVVHGCVIERVDAPTPVFTYLVPHTSVDVDDLQASVQLSEGCETPFAPSDHTVEFTEA